MIDARGPRFGATITAVVLAFAIAVGPNAVGTALIAVQVLVFALGALAGLQAQPYGIVYRQFVRPRLSGPVPLESPEPPRFAQAVGLAFAAVALVGALSGASTVYTVAASFALAASFLNAAFAFCLGCELYLLGKRILAK